MPILASLGTANDRAFGFGDGSFSSGYDLPAIITNNAEIIYDASNPLSNALGRSSFSGHYALFPSFNSNDRRYGDYWFIPVTAGTPIFPGDIIKNYPQEEHAALVIDVERNVTMNNTWGGGTVTGDRVVINSYMVYDPIVVYPSSTNYWYDISGNNRHATWSAEPVVSGAGGNQILTADSSHILSVPDALTGSFVYLMLLSKAADKSILGQYNGDLTWRMDYFLSDSMPYFHSVGSGGDSRNGDYVSYDNRPAYILHRAEISGGAGVSRYGGISTYYTSGRDFSGTQHSQMTVGNGTGSVPIKFIALYRPENAPTIEQAYNALKGRFNL